MMMMSRVMAVRETEERKIFFSDGRKPCFRFKISSFEGITAVFERNYMFNGLQMNSCQTQSLKVLNA